MLSIMCICGLIGCEKDSVSEVTVDYGTSSIYSEDDMNEAIELVKDEFVTWEGMRTSKYLLFVGRRM